MNKQMLNAMKLIALTALILICLTACDTTKQVPVPQEMVGTWVGLGHHTLGSDFLNQKEIPFMLIITEKGTINGYVGDATIKKTVMQKTAWWLKLIGKEKYRSIVQLSGNIVNQESFHRSSGTLFFNTIGSDDMNCSFTTEGSQVTSNNMALPIKDIKLRHPD